jgi:hypothetical protein
MAMLLFLALALFAAPVGAQALAGGCPPTSSAASKSAPPSMPLSTTASTASPAPEQIVACVGSQSITGAAQTFCEPGYATSDCGHVQASL